MPEGPMRILFLNYTFPGPLGTMAASLAALPGNEVLFASEYGRRVLAPWRQEGSSEEAQGQEEGCGIDIDPRP